MVLKLILERHVVWSFSKSWSLFWRRRQLWFIRNRLGMRRRVAMIVLVVHGFCHLLLDSFLLHGIPAIYDCWCMLHEILRDHSHLPAITIHVSSLKFIFKVFLVSSGRIWSKNIRLVDFMVSTAVFMFFRVHSEQSVLAGMSCSLLIMWRRAVRVRGTTWIL